jgi:hypothetical protein
VRGLHRRPDRDQAGGAAGAGSGHGCPGAPPADGADGYAQAVAAITVEVVARTSPHSFQVLRRRWVVERTFGWLMRYRRLARDYERTTANSEAMIYWATVIIMTRRLARYGNGQPPAQRWGGERDRPTGQPALSAGSTVVALCGDRYPAPGR